LGEIDGLEVGSLRVESHLDGKEEDLCDSLPHDPQETPLFLCLRGEMKQQLARAIADLPEKERQVMLLYYFRELTMKEVGAVLGVGESRVSQIHSTAVVRLRAVVILGSSKPSEPTLPAPLETDARQERSLGQSAG
jgi:RNA polymerase sigma factor FliA